MIMKMMITLLQMTMMLIIMILVMAMMFLSKRFSRLPDHRGDGDYDNAVVKYDNGDGNDKDGDGDGDVHHRVVVQVAR